MPPLPKRKYAKARQGGRRSHLKLVTPNLVACSQCHNLKLPHRVCPTCGSYAGREVVEIKSSARRG